MVFGGIDSEVVVSTRPSLWSGGPYSPENPELLAALPQARSCCGSSSSEANTLTTQQMMAKPATRRRFSRWAIFC